MSTLDTITREIEQLSDEDYTGRLDTRRVATRYCALSLRHVHCSM